MEHATAQVVVEVLEEEIFARHGPPESVHSDQRGGASLPATSSER
jgi:hypothetical protein